MTQIMQDILKLSVPERNLVVEDIWDSIAEKEEQVELSAEIMQLLDERLEAQKTRPLEGSNWNDVKARIQSRF